MIATAAAFCAICVADIGWSEPVRMQPLGKGDALVRVCAKCDEGHVQAVEPRGYEPPGGIGAKFCRSVADSKRDLVGDESGYFGHASLSALRTKDWILIRIPIRDCNGVARDRSAIAARFESEPWGASVRYLGSSVDMRGVAWMLFERPPVVKLASDRHPLEAIEQYRVLRPEDVQHPTAKVRRDRRRAAKLCINGESHGKATHGTLCERCRVAHRGSPRRSA